MSNKFLIYSILLSTIGNLVAWVHMNAQFKWPWAKGALFITLVGIPISWCFYYSTRYGVEHFGHVWSVRMVGFGIGTLTFGILTWLFLGEIPSIKIIISLLLAAAIILLQFMNL